MLILTVLLLADLALRRNLVVAMKVNEGRICLSKQLARHLPIQQCEDRFLRASHDFPGSARVHGALGFIYFQIGRFNQAVQEFRASASHNSVEGLYLGLALDEIGLRYRAVQVWRSAGASRYFFSRGESLKKKRSLEVAAQQFEKAILVDPDFDEARIALAGTYIDLAEYDKAEMILDDRVTQISTVRGYFLLGLARYRQGNNLGAEEAYLQALRMDSDNYGAKWWLGHVYWRQKRWKDALEIFRPLSIGSAKGLWAVGAILKRLGDRTAALQSFLNGIDVDPKYMANYLGAADIYEWRDQMEKAIITYEKVLIVEPDNKFVQDKVQALRNGQK